MGSKMHLMLDDDLVRNYNRSQHAFAEAQREHKKTTGENWKPEEPLLIKWSQVEFEAQEKIAELINLIIQINGGVLDISEEDCPHAPYFVKV
jgi:hypothetical protein